MLLNMGCLKRDVVAMVIAGVVGCSVGAHAQTPSRPAPQKLVETTVKTGSSEQGKSRIDATDLVTGQLWGLSIEEMDRVKMLMQGPRKAFSVPNISPLEILGIHARNEAERRKYAEMFAKAFKADVDRSLAWNSAFDEAIHRETEGTPVIDYSKMPKVMAPVGAADLGNVPRSQIIEPPRASGKPKN